MSTAISSMIFSGIAYALSFEFSKQSITLTTNKIFEILGFFVNRAYIESNDDQNDFNYKIKNFLEKNYVKLKIENAESYLNIWYDTCIKEFDQKKVSPPTPIELNIQSLHICTDKIKKELELLQNLILNHDKLYFARWRTPNNYEKHLKNLDYLINHDFEIRFKWLSTAILLNRSTKL